MRGTLPVSLVLALLGYSGAAIKSSVLPIYRSSTARSMAAASATETEVRLITNRLCPFAQRTWIALEEAGVPFKFEEVDLYGAGGKPGWFLKLNPKGQVPVLVVGERVVVESEQTIDAVRDLSPESFAGDLELVSNWRRRIAEFIPQGKQAIQVSPRHAPSTRCNN